MPNVKGYPMDPDAAYAAGLCPECGLPLADFDPPSHALMHWTRPIGNGPEYDIARKRFKQISEYVAPPPEPSAHDLLAARVAAIEARLAK